MDRLSHRTAPLDADAQILLLGLSLGRLLPASLASAEQIRTAWRMTTLVYARRAPVAAVESFTIESAGHQLRLRLYRPLRGSGRHQPTPAVVWFHGGAFIAGDLETAEPTCRTLAARSGCAFLSVGYRLAPEATLHEAVEDCAFAYRWLHANATRLMLDQHRVLVGGDSAGGTLAALIVHLSHPAPKPLAQILAYPCTDLDMDLLGEETHQAPVSLDMLRRCRQLAAERTDLAETSLSPLKAPELSDAPATILLVAGHDPLRKQIIDYAEHLESAGVRVRTLDYPGQFHGFLVFDRVLPTARRALDRLGEEIGRIASPPAVS